MTIQNPKISIVIPSYNKVKFIEQTLNSIFDQGYFNLEIIIQDGGSTDGTIEIIKKFAKKYPVIIKFVSEKDKGQLDAIDKGLRKATGEILTFINADDVYAEGAFRKVASAYEKNPKALWFAGYGKMINEKGDEIARFWTSCKNMLLSINSYPLLLLTSNYLFQPSVFINREAYKKYGPFSGVEKYVFEYEMWLKLGRVSMPAVVPHTLSKFRIGKSNMSSLYYKHLFTKDLEVTQKYSGNFFIVFLHRLNNVARLMSIKLMKQ